MVPCLFLNILSQPLNGPPSGGRRSPLPMAHRTRNNVEDTNSAASANFTTEMHNILLAIGASKFIGVLIRFPYPLLHYRMIGTIVHCDPSSSNQVPQPCIGQSSLIRTYVSAPSQLTRVIGVPRMSCHIMSFRGSLRRCKGLNAVHSVSVSYCKRARTAGIQSHAWASHNMYARFAQNKIWPSSTCSDQQEASNTILESSDHFRTLLQSLAVSSGRNTSGYLYPESPSANADWRRQPPPSTTSAWPLT